MNTLVSLAGCNQQIWSSPCLRLFAMHCFPRGEHNKETPLGWLPGKKCFHFFTATVARVVCSQLGASASVTYLAKATLSDTSICEISRESCHIGADLPSHFPRGLTSTTTEGLPLRSSLSPQLSLIKGTLKGKKQVGLNW